MSTSESPKSVDHDTLSACYTSLLGRSPDATATKHWVEAGNGSLGDVLLTILASDEFAIRWRDVLHRRLGGGELKFFNEHSQFGEVGLLLREMINRRARRKLVVDVGANGRERSNSYDLLKHFSWRGLLIEANPGRDPVIRNEFAGLDYSLVLCAVSDYSGDATFHIGQNDDVSSLQRASTEAWGAIRDTITVPVRPLSEVLREHDIPDDFDLLSIDAEGEDVRILNNTISSGYTPEWVIMETGQLPPGMPLRDLGLSEQVAETYEILAITVANVILHRR